MRQRLDKKAVALSSVNHIRLWKKKGDKVAVLPSRQVNDCCSALKGFSCSCLKHTPTKHLPAVFASLPPLTSPRTLNPRPSCFRQPLPFFTGAACTVPPLSDPPGAPLGEGLSA